MGIDFHPRSGGYPEYGSHHGVGSAIHVPGCVAVSAGIAVHCICSCSFEEVCLSRAVGQGILRGCGMQTTGAILAFVGFYVVSLPTSFGLAFKAHMGLRGLWLGELAPQ